MRWPSFFRVDFMSFIADALYFFSNLSRLTIFHNLNAHKSVKIEIDMKLLELSESSSNVWKKTEKITKKYYKPKKLLEHP